jgi:hypothetical protein
VAATWASSASWSTIDWSRPVEGVGQLADLVVPFDGQRLPRAQALAHLVQPLRRALQGLQLPAHPPPRDEPREQRERRRPAEQPLLHLADHQKGLAGRQQRLHQPARLADLHRRRQLLDPPRADRHARALMPAEVAVVHRIDPRCRPGLHHPALVGRGDIGARPGIGDHEIPRPAILCATHLIQKIRLVQVGDAQHRTDETPSGRADRLGDGEHRGTGAPAPQRRGDQRLVALLELGEEAQVPVVPTHPVVLARHAGDGHAIGIQHDHAPVEHRLQPRLGFEQGLGGLAIHLPGIAQAPGQLAQNGVPLVHRAVDLGGDQGHRGVLLGRDRRLHVGPQVLADHQCDDPDRRDGGAQGPGDEPCSQRLP